MLQPLNTEGLNKFRAHVYALKLRFPVAMIARSTGEDRANVSRYIRGQIPASQQFLKRFYASYKDDLEKAGIYKIPDPVYDDPPPPAAAPAEDIKMLAAIERRLAEIAHTLKDLEQRQSTTERFLLEYLSRSRGTN